MATKLRPCCRIVNLDTDAEIGRSGNVLPGSRIRRTLSASGELEVRLPLWDPLVGLLIAAVGGPTYTGPTLPYLLELSWAADPAGGGDGEVWDSACWAESLTLTISGDAPELTVSTKDLFSGYERTYVDRVSFVDVPLGQVAYGDFGTIQQPAGSLMSPGGAFPWQRGLLRSVPGRDSLKGAGRLAFTCVVDPALAGVPLVMDVNQDSVARALTTALQAAAGAYRPTADPAPLGTRQYFSVDCAARTVYVGRVPQTPSLTLRAGVDSHAPDGAAPLAIGERFEIAPSAEEMRGQSSYRGGASNHGLPDGARITGVVVINTQVPGAPASWDASLCVVGISTGDEGGGVFYLVDKDFYPASQRMDVNALAVGDPRGRHVYAATNAGVRHADVGARPTTWPLLGGLTARVDKLHVCGDQGAGVWTVAAVAAGSANGPGANGVYISPALAGDAANDAVGWAGWSRVCLQECVDALWSDAAQAVLFAPTSDPATLVRQPAAGGAPTTTDLGADLQGFAAVPYAGLPPGLAWTALGGLGIYQIGADLAATALGVLADDAGALGVSALCAYPPGWSINGVAVRYLAATDRGLYFATAAGGAAWSPAGGPNSIDQEAGAYLAAGTVQQVIERSLVRLFVASDRSLFVSSSGGEYFQDVLATPLDLGPIWYALAQRNGATPFPDNNVGALSTTGGGGAASAGSILGGTTAAAAGGNGSTLSIRPSDPLAPPGGLQIARRMTERNEFTYRVVDPASNAPYNQLDPGEVTQITADDARDAIVASRQLLQEHYRSLLVKRQPRMRLTAMSQFWTAEAPLRFALAGDCHAVDYTLRAGGVTVCAFADQPFWVVDYEATLTEGGVEVVETLGTMPVLQELTLDEIAAGTADDVQRDRRYSGARSRRH